MKNFILLLISLLVLASCEKTSDYDPAPPATDVTVYVSGASFNIATQLFEVTYWKDSVQYFMSDHPTNSFGNAIYVVGNQVYVAGQSSAWFPTAGLWLNGTPKGTTDNSKIGDVKSLVVSGNDIYMAGSGPDASGNYPNGDETRAKWWKNGVTKELGDDTVWSEATDIAVSGSDVYVSWFDMPKGWHRGKYTKNGITTTLGGEYFESYAKAICVSGSDVYVLGWVGDSAKQSRGVYWKNGIMNKISSTDDYAYGSDILVSDGNLYISGTEFVSGKGLPAYWKNGEKHSLSPIPDLALTSGIAVYGDDVYVSGRQGVLANPVYWKNGIAQKLSVNPSLYDGHMITGIFVVKK